jgi:hypothetical protein
MEPTTLEAIAAMRKKELSDTRTALDQLHKKMASANKRKRDQEKRRHDSKKGCQMAQFEVGDFVLYMNVWACHRDKLSVRWSGPAVVEEVISEWIFLIRNLITHDIREAHASRMRFYDDSKRLVDEELLAHVAFNSEGHIIDSFQEVREKPHGPGWEVYVRWRGLERTEDSWEPAEIVLEDVPPHLARWCKTMKTDPIVHAMMKGLEMEV